MLIISSCGEKMDGQATLSMAMHYPLGLPSAPGYMYIYHPDRVI